MNKKHLIFSSYDDIDNPIYGGGGAWATFEVARRLAKNLRITIVTGKHKNGGPDTREGIIYKRIGFAFLPPIVNQLVYQVCLPFVLLTSHFDVWVESFTPPYTTAFLPLFTKKPVFGIAHFLNAEEKARQYHLPFTLLETLGLRQYKNIMVFNPKQAEKIKKVNPHANIFFINNGSTITPKKASRKKGNYILFLGRIEMNQKGLDLLIQAFTHVHKRLPTLKLIVAGKGSAHDEDQLQKLVQKNGLGSSVTLIGKVNGKVKEQYIHEARAVVFSSRYEGQSLVALESILLGTPLITFDIDGFSWLTTADAIKITAFDTKRYAQAIISLIENAAIGKKMEQHYHTIANNFSWDGIAKTYQNILFGQKNT